MTAPALAEWLSERFEADLEERRGRVAAAIASRTAEQAADYESRLEPGTVISPSGTMTIAPRSDEVFGEPRREASAGAAVVPIVAVAPAGDIGMPPRMSEPPLPRRRRPRWVLPVAAGTSALVAACVVWWTLGPSAAQSSGDVFAEAAAVGAVAEPAAEVVEPDLAPAAEPEPEAPATEPEPAVPPAEPEPAAAEADGEGTSDPVMTFAPDPSPRAAADAPARPARRGRGFFTIDSMPYATIYVDGAKKGVTPILRLSLPAGKHEVVAVTADGRRQKFQVAIAPGEEAKRRKLTW